MALKNSEYNAILRQYDQRQFQNLRSQEKCRQKVYEKVPGIRALDEQIAHTAAEYARKSILQKSPQILGRFKADMKLLEEEKSRLLIAHGFPKDYLQLHYHCADCKDTGFIGNEKCHCFKQAIADLIYEQSNIREKIKHENFSSFNMDYYPDRPDPQLGISPRENIKNVLAVCRRFIDTFAAAAQNLLFYGQTGVGKTFLSNCIAREILAKNYTVIYLTAFGLVDAFENNTFGNNDENDVPENMFNYILDCDLLIIDDLGTEMNNSFVTSQLFLCINERLLREKSTVISTNLSIEQIQKEYSERIFSRIVGHYEFLPIIGDDIRVKKAIAP